MGIFLFVFYLYIYFHRVKNAIREGVLEIGSVYRTENSQICFFSDKY